MFFPERMQKADLVILKNEVEAVSKEVVKFGDFEMIEIGPDKLKDCLLNKTFCEAELSKYVEYDRRINFLLTYFENFFPKFLSESSEGEEDILNADQIEQSVKEIETEINQYNQQAETLKLRKIQIEIKIRQINYFSNMNLDLSKFKDLRYFYTGFGTVPLNSYDGFLTALSTLPSEVHHLGDIGDDALVFFALPRSMKDKMDNILKSVFYREYGISYDLEKNAKSKLVAYAFDLSAAQDEEIWQERNFQKTKHKTVSIMGKMKKSVLYHISMSNLKGEMASTQKIMLLSGWVPSASITKLKRVVEKITENRCVFMNEKASVVMEKEGLVPPTKFSNPWFLKPFEALVGTFGMPNYREIDPTPFAAIAYVLMYGAMFGDVGHGIVLALLGLLILSIKKMKPMHSLAAVIFYIGLSSVLFGFLYGEIFGKEEIFKPLWMSPAHHIMDILMIAVAFGAAMISIGILLSIINSILERNYGRLFFSPNGLAGLAFYWSLLYGAYGIINNVSVPSFIWWIPVGAGILIALEKMLEGLLFPQHGEHAEPVNPVLGFVELFEAVISFLSNTVSFMRVGAFALNHGALMSVVFLIASGMKDPITQWIAILIGNIFVIGVEGFIVGIQALRLEYYEFFVKFFRANGRAFEGVGINKENAL
jgi:V/A-type H+-transporting ATPase subunit I